MNKHYVTGMKTGCREFKLVYYCLQGNHVSDNSVLQMEYASPI